MRVANRTIAEMSLVPIGELHTWLMSLPPQMTDMQRGIAEPVDPAIYLHALQNFRSRMNIVIRTEGDPLLYVERVKEAIWSLNAAQTITRVSTLLGGRCCAARFGRTRRPSR